LAVDADISDGVPCGEPHEDAMTAEVITLEERQLPKLKAEIVGTCVEMVVLGVQALDALVWWVDDDIRAVRAHSRLLGDLQYAFAIATRYGTPNTLARHRRRMEPLLPRIAQHRAMSPYLHDVIARRLKLGDKP
jgi:hypothetical protein